MLINLDRRIQLLASSISYNEANEPVTTYVTEQTVWASRAAVAVSESQKASEIAALATVKFTVRWSMVVERLDPTWRLRHGDENYDIVGKREIGRRAFVEIEGRRRTESPATYDMGSP
jgi:head-tail adaptor